MLLAPQPIMPRQSPMFLEVPRPHHLRRSRSRSKSRGVDPARRRNQSIQYGSPDSAPALVHRISSPPPRPQLSPDSPRKDRIPAAERITPAVTVPAHQPVIVEDASESYYGLPASPSPDPCAEPSLRSQLVGAWRLESYIAYPTPTSQHQRPTYPMTKSVTGFIMYTPDGYMSAQMLIPGQNNDAFKTKGGGDVEAWAEAAKRCFSYAGPYYISDEGPDRREVLRHTFQICSLPGWVSDVQVRTWSFEEDGKVLVLGSEEPTEIKGDLRHPVLKWRRCIDNSLRDPPPPVPQIKVSGPGEP